MYVYNLSRWCLENDIDRQISIDSAVYCAGGWIRNYNEIKSSGSSSLFLSDSEKSIIFHYQRTFTIHEASWHLLFRIRTQKKNKRKKVFLENRYFLFFFSSSLDSCDLLIYLFVNVYICVSLECWIWAVA